MNSQNPTNNDGIELAALGDQLDLLEQSIGPLVEAFVTAGHRFYVVGGWVRDLLLATHPDLIEKRAPSSSTSNTGTPEPNVNNFALNDIDVTTDARPEKIERLLRDWAETVWTAGIAFGTVNGRRGSFVVEITTHRGEHYQKMSRKPTVTFSDDIKTDLGRRDFTINAFAIELPSRQFIDPYDGLSDLQQRVLQAPSDPIQLFGEDPLRILRAARFTAAFSLQPTSAVVAAMRQTCGRLAIVSAERISMELQKLLSLPRPGKGVALLERTGVLTHLGVTRVGSDLTGPDLIDTGSVDTGSTAGLAAVVNAIPDHDARWAGLAYLGGHSPNQARELLASLRYSKAVCKHVESILQALHDLQEASSEASQETRSTEASQETRSTEASQEPSSSASQVILKPIARRLVATHGSHLHTAKIVGAAVGSVVSNGADKANGSEENAARSKERLHKQLLHHQLPQRLFHQTISQDLLDEIHHIETTEEAPQLGKPLDGKAMLSIAKQHGHKLVGSQIGDALYFLLESHFHEGPLSPERAEALLVERLVELTNDPE